MGGFNTMTELSNIQYHDKLKNSFCEKHGIELLRIHYKDYDIIEEKLEGFL